MSFRRLISLTLIFSQVLQTGWGSTSASFSEQALTQPLMEFLHPLISSPEQKQLYQELRQAKRELSNKRELWNTYPLPEEAYPAAAGLFYSFKEYMDLMLHDAPWGFYASGRVHIGNDGDFTTFPELLKPYFGQLVMEQAFRLWNLMREDGRLGPDETFSMVEFGGGNGQMAEDALEHLSFKADMEPTTWGVFKKQFVYKLYERSPQLRKQQQLHNLKFEPQFQSHAGDARDPGVSLLANSIKGLVVSNEVPDAFGVHKLWLRRGQASAAFVIPHISQGLLRLLVRDKNLLHRIQQQNEEIKKRTGLARWGAYLLSRTSLNELMAYLYSAPSLSNKFLLAMLGLNESYLPIAWAPDAKAYLETHAADYGRAYEMQDKPVLVTVNPDADRYIEGVGRALKQGYVLTIDYGRTTDAIFRRAHAGDTLVNVTTDHLPGDLAQSHFGRSDLTSYPNFSSLITAGVEVGLSQEYFGTQRGLLIGVPELDTEQVDRDGLLLFERNDNFLMLLQRKNALPSRTPVIPLRLRERSELVLQGKVVKTTEPGLGLRANLNVCLAVAAFNSKTGQRVLAHLLPTGHVRKSVEPSMLNERKAAYIDRLLGDIKGPDWHVEIVESVPMRELSAVYTIYARDLFGFLVDRQQVDPSQIVMSNQNLHGSHKMVLIGSNGQIQVREIDPKEFLPAMLPFGLAFNDFPMFAHPFTTMVAVVVAVVLNRSLRHWQSRRSLASAA